MHPLDSCAAELLQRADYLSCVNRTREFWRQMAYAALLRGTHKRAMKAKKEAELEQARRLRSTTAHRD